MAKTSKEQIDADERKVIRELQKGSKESIDKIAKNCGFSRQKVWRTIKRLEKNKTIWGYSTIVDDEKLGLKKYLILLKRTNEPLSKEKLMKIINGKLKQEFEGLGVNVEFTFFVNGCYDFALCATSENIRLMKKFCEALYSIFKDCISDIQILEVIFPLQQSCLVNPNLEELIGYFSTG